MINPINKLQKTKQMTNKQMMQDINKTARKIKKDGSAVDINYSLPHVDINGNLSFFFQGEEASNLIAEATEASNKFNTTVENTILWMAAGW